HRAGPRYSPEKIHAPTPLPRGPRPGGFRISPPSLPARRPPLLPPVRPAGKANTPGRGPPDGGRGGAKERAETLPSRPKAAPAAKKKRAGGKKAAAEGKAASAALKDRLFDLRKKGFNRLFQNGQMFEFSTPESLLDVDFTQPLFVLVDRIVVAPDQRSRIVD